jgi:hypothetical protein
MWGRWAEGAPRTVVCSFLLDLGSEFELQIQLRELLLDDAYM